jgi:hypothetical protein
MDFEGSLSMDFQSDGLQRLYFMDFKGLLVYFSIYGLQRLFIYGLQRLYFMDFKGSACLLQHL